MLINALISALVIAVLAYIADFFLAKSGLEFPRNLIWIVAFVVWLLVVMGRINIGL